ncbi:hypothetical protein [uncultured Algibacter sp.]|uniref:hypothetical protein n=1 Tax=uncultured Algibacter sp. TaxID=298659 RepID=UPI0026387FBE|nr:hypothetical protein [uncultured Algibacter sp.]
MNFKFIFFIVLLIPLISVAQSIELGGKVISKANMDTENIHVINKTAQLFTTSGKQGDFRIVAKLNDTLLFSSIQFKPKEVIISEEILQSKTLFVNLEEQINVLDEVLVGKVLTGDLLFDVRQTEGKAPLNFYDVGIPGYKGKPATQSERRLHEATSGSGIIPLNPIINAITGRTKELKEHIKIERKDALMRSIKVRLSADFFISNPLEEDFKMDYFYFCMDDKDFMIRCKNKTDLEVLLFMEEKYVQYMENRKRNKN